jgi:hypothetical protein
MTKTLNRWKKKTTRFRTTVDVKVTLYKMKYSCKHTGLATVIDISINAYQRTYVIGIKTTPEYC